jgi:hypothetical protein
MAQPPRLGKAGTLCVRLSPSILPAYALTFPDFYGGCPTTEQPLSNRAEIYADLTASATTWIISGVNSG